LPACRELIVLLRALGPLIPAVAALKEMLTAPLESFGLVQLGIAAVFGVLLGRIARRQLLVGREIDD
jgi:hypothetical protein